MSKLDKKPRSQNQRGRTVHDLSHDFKFTAACGHILPIEADIILPGDTIDCGVDMFSRNIQPFLAPAFANFDFHVDYFFVPMTLIYQPFASTIYGINQEFSSVFTTSAKALPYVNKDQLYSFFQFCGEDIPDNGFEEIGVSTLRLLDMFGINPYQAFSASSGAIGDFMPNFFPWQFAAYQCVYQYYFRDEDLELFDNSTFNLDKYGVSGSTNYIPGNSSSYSNNALCKLMQMRYHRAYGDYFLGMSRSPLINTNNLQKSSQIAFGSADELLKTYTDLGNLQGILTGQYTNTNNLDVSANNPNTQFRNAPLSVAGKATVSRDATFPYVDSVGAKDNYARTTDQLRKLFAVEKLVTITERNKKTYDAQTLGHFGINVPHDVKHEISHIGHDKSEFHIGEITALASGSDGTSGVTFGEYGGRGQMALKAHRHRFTAPCHGVFLVTFSIVPRYDYLVENLKRNFVTQRLDFFQPEFDDLGMQPIYKYEVTGRISQFDGDSAAKVAPSSASAQIQGWQYRYEQYKRGINRVSHAFATTELSAWTLKRTPFRFGNSFGSASGMAPGSDEVSYYNWLYNNYGYVSPHDTDGIFAVEYGAEVSDDVYTYPHRIYQGDPFVVYSHIDYKKVSVMSTYSVPKLD